MTRYFGMSIASLAASSRSIIQTRSGSLPSSTTRFITSIVDGGDPASLTVVRPLARLSREASSITWRRSASTWAGVRVARSRARASPISDCARSLNKPLGLPSASLRIFPPAGSGVALVTSAIFIASALAKPAWPLACVSQTGLFGAALLSASCSGKPSMLGEGTSDHFSWCQPRPRIHSPGRAVRAASATMRTISSQFFAVESLRLRAASPTPVKCTCASMKPGVASAPFRSITLVLAPM